MVERNAMNRQGFTLVEMMIVVALMGVLASVAIPNYINAREIAFKNACSANLTQLNSSIDMFQIDKGAWPGNFTPSLDPYMRTVPTACPENSNLNYTLVAAVSANPAEATCSTTGHVAQ